MKFHSFIFVFTLIFFALNGFGQSFYYRKAAIQLGEKATPVEKKIADLLVSRLEELPEISAHFVIDHGKFQKDDCKRRQNVSQF